MKKHLKHILLIIIIIFAILLLIGIGYELYISKYGLTATYYTLSNDKGNEKIRIVQLTDLHGSRFGSKNERLISLLEKQSPDLIIITGDLIDQSDSDISDEIALVEELCGIAPVYFSYGNHEKFYEGTHDTDVKSLLEGAGATVLEYSYEDIQINGGTVRIGGIYGYCLPEKYEDEANKDEIAFLKEFQDTDYYTILLAHMPTCWIVNDGINEWDVDCVFAGHVHGGQVRLPFVGGLYAPDQGWFPGEECGLYYSNEQDKVMVLSRGLGSTEKIPRFNNIPEIVVVDVGE